MRKICRVLGPVYHLAIMSLAAAQFDADVRQFPDYDIVHRADRAYYPTVA